MGFSSAPKLPSNPHRWLRVSCALVLALLVAPASNAQEMTALQKVQALGNPTLAGRVTVYYSPGYEKRAQELQSTIEEAMGFYERNLKVKADLNLAVLTPEQWAQARKSPYGLPGFSESPNVIFLPATATGVVTRGTLGREGSISPATLAKIASTGYSFEQGAVELTDLIAMHELGHVYAIGLGLHPTRLNKWFSEFLGSYLAYAYLRQEHPELATLFHAMAADVAMEGPRPQYTSLEDFERLYTGVGPGNYSWYQGRFLQRVAQVYERKGLSFIPEVRAAFPAPEQVAPPVAVVLQRLEKISPGFIEWSEDMR